MSIIDDILNNSFNKKSPINGSPVPSAPVPGVFEGQLDPAITFQPGSVVVPGATVDTIPVQGYRENGFTYYDGT